MSQDWSVLDRPGSPAPGDVVQVRALAGRLIRNAETAERNTSRLRGIAAGGGDLRLQGEFAGGYLAALGELPGELEKLGRAYRGCGDALSGYAAELDTAQVKASQAWHDGSQAHWSREDARRRIRSLVPEHAELARRDVFRSGLESESRLALITDASLQQLVREAVVKARLADESRDRAKWLADQAAELHRQAEDRAVHRIDEALSSSGIRNPGFWERVGGFFADHFGTWDAFLDTLEVVVAVLAIAALIFSGVGLLGLLVLVLGAALVIGRFIQAASGNGSWADVGLALLYMLPGSRAIGTFFRSARFLAPLRGALAGSRALSGIRSVLGAPGQFARNLLCRVVGRDPVDMATGEMVLPQTDLVLPAATLPLTISRTYVSSYRAGRLFGPAWSTPLDQRLELDPSGVYYAAADGMLQQFPVPESDDPVRAVEGEPVALRLLHDGTFTVTDPRIGVTLHFGEIADTPMGVFSLLRAVDRNGNAVEYDYAGGVLTSVRHFGGYTIDVVTQDGLVTAFRLRGARGEGDQELVRYAYDAAGRLTGITNSSGRPLTFGYDEQNRIVSWTDRNGRWYRYTYDDSGRCVRTEGADGILNGTIAYDPHTTVETNSLGHATTYHFNEVFQVQRIVDPLGNATAMTWDRHNHLLSRTDPLGNTTRFAYDQDGNLTEVRRADGTHGTATYNAESLPMTVVEPDGATWRYRYDGRGNLVGVTDPQRQQTTFQVDEHGWLVATIDPAGQASRFQTNSAGLLTSATDPAGATLACTYDPLGRVAAVTDPLGAATHFSWTTEGRLASVTAPDGATQRWIYDGEGNVVEHVDAAGAVTSSEPVGFDQVGTYTAADGSRTTITYDTEQRPVAVTNPQGLVWRLEYDAAGRMVRETDFSGRVVTYAYDAAARLVGRTNALGQTVSFRLDPMGRIVERDADGVVSACRYDAAGRIVAATGAGADLRFERDEVGRVVAQTSNGRTTRNEYDALGRRTARTTPSGARTEWSYAATRQPTRVRVGSHELHWGRDPLGRETRRSVGALTLAQVWDSASRLSAQTLADAAGQLVQHRGFTYRADNQVTAIHDHLTGTHRYDLDVVGRVTALQSSDGWSEQYRYDAAGNITQALSTAAAESDLAEATGPRDYLGSRVQTAGRVRYEHDAQGRVVLRQRRDDRWRYSWDAEDRLVAVMTPDGTRWTYQYDPLGRRIGKTRLDADGRPVEQVDFTWDGGLLIEASTGDGHVTTWDYAGNQPITQRDRLGQDGLDARFYAIVTDLVGTPTELLTPDGTLVWHARRTLWGEPLSAPASTVDCPLGFPGQYRDRETELHYNVYRYYDPVSGRYASNDPIGLLGGLNPHQYVPNPITWVDPLGLAGCLSWLTSRVGSALSSDFGRGALNNVLAQLINDSMSAGGLDVNWEHLGLAALAGGIGGHWGGRHLAFGSGLTSFLTNSFIQLDNVAHGGTASLEQLVVSTGIGTIFGGFGHGAWDNAATQAGKEWSETGVAALIGFFDVSGLVFPTSSGGS